MKIQDLKVAIVHDQLIEFGGAERVLVQLLKIFPQAEIFTSFCNPNSLGFHWKKFENHNIHESSLAKIPFIKKLISPLRFLFPYIWESFELKKFDLVISSSGGWSSHGVKTSKNQLHICYLHTPPRYLYGYETALEWRKYALIRWYGNLINHFLRLWDFQAAQRPNYFIANSLEVQKRIKRFYVRDSEVIYPPVSLSEKNIFLENFDAKAKITQQLHKKYYLTVSRLAGAKHVEVQLDAARSGKFDLKVVGKGRQAQMLKRLAPSSVEFFADVKDEEFANIFAGARAFLNTAVDEEFGISAVEALGRGVPVIAFGQAGLLETVQDGVTGMLFQENNGQSLWDTITQYEKLTTSQIQQMSQAAFKSARKFSEKEFSRQIINFVQEKLSHARTSRS